jgi:hypothetical protein
MPNAQVEGHFETVPTIGNIHEVNILTLNILTNSYDWALLDRSGLTSSVA